MPYKITIKTWNNKKVTEVVKGSFALNNYLWLCDYCNVKKIKIKRIQNKRQH